VRRSISTSDHSEGSCRDGQISINIVSNDEYSKNSGVGLDGEDTLGAARSPPDRAEIRSPREAMHSRADSLTAFRPSNDRPGVDRRVREGDLGAAPGKAGFTGSVARRGARACHGRCTRRRTASDEIGREIDGAARLVRYKVQLSQSAVIG
jgi:hypothetical protein